MPCRPPIMFWITVGHASLHTTPAMGPSTIERSKREDAGAAWAGGAAFAGTSAEAVASVAGGAGWILEFYYRPAANVLQACGSPESNPRLNHVTRCADVPCVNFSGMTRPVP